MRQLGWLASIPTPEAQAVDKRDKRTRGERMREQGIPVAIPVVSHGLHLIEHLFDAGPVQQSEMGVAPLSSLELEAWKRGTSVPLEPWEFQLLRDLSKAYLSEMLSGRDPMRPAPYIEFDQDARDAVGKQVAETLRARALQRRAEERKKKKRAAKAKKAR